MSACATQETISAIITNACRTFAWGKRSDTWKTMLGYIRDIALEEFQLSLADLEASSLKLAKDMTREEYDTAITDYNWQNEPNLNIKFQSIPYIFCVGSDGIITVVFNEQMRYTTCDIKEITKEMMELIKYMGLVRMYILENTKFTIPFLPDNIIHLDINNHRVMTAMDREHNFSFPRFLRGLIDNPNSNNSQLELNTLTYTNRLPDTLIRLETLCHEYSNLPCNLVYYKLFSYYDGRCDIPKFELFPIGIKSIIICCEPWEVHGKFRCNGSIQFPSKIEYLEIPIDHILVDNMIFSNIRELYLRKFRNWVPRCNLQIGDYTGNLTLMHEFLCSECGTICDGLKHTTKIILEEGIEHLMIDFTSSASILKLIEIVPASLTLLTIGRFLIHNEQNPFKRGVRMEVLPTISSTQFLINSDKESYDIMIMFQKKFPHVGIKIY